MMMVDQKDQVPVLASRERQEGVCKIPQGLLVAVFWLSTATGSYSVARGRAQGFFLQFFARGNLSFLIPHRAHLVGRSCIFSKSDNKGGFIGSTDP